MKKYATTKKELSCIIGNLFREIMPPCEKCGKYEDAIVITGITNNGNEATILITEKDGIYYFEGEEEELQEIKESRCIYVSRL